MNKQQQRIASLPHYEAGRSPLVQVLGHPRGGDPARAHRLRHYYNDASPAKIRCRCMRPSLTAAFGSPRKVWVLLQNIAMLLCIALAVTPAFKMRFWNIGGEGQVLMPARSQRRRA